MPITRYKCTQGLHPSTQRGCIQGPSNNCPPGPLRSPNSPTLEIALSSLHKTSSGLTHDIFRHLLVPALMPHPHMPRTLLDTDSSLRTLGGRSICLAPRCPCYSTKYLALTIPFHLYDPNAMKEITFWSPRWSLSEHRFE